MLLCVAILLKNRWIEKSSVMVDGNNRIQVIELKTGNISDTLNYVLLMLTCNLITKI